MRHFGFMAAFGNFIDGLVHASVAADPIEGPRHRSFIAVNLTGGLVALAALPLYLVIAGPTSLVEALALMALAAPAPIALRVAQTGSLALGHALLAIAAAALVAWVACFTGGLSSYAFLWLTVVPIEASLSGSRRIIGFAAVVSAASVALVAGLDLAGLLPAARLGFVSASVGFGLIAFAAVLYTTMLALRIDSHHTVTEQVARDREAHFRLVADNITDIVSGHGPNGDILYVSPAVERVLGIPPLEALGDGLFRRVHVADRPAYLTALSNAVMRGATSAVEFRVKVEAEDGSVGHVWLEMRCRPTQARDPGAKGGEVVAVTRDITERKAQEAELLRAREQAEQGSLAKTQFLANVSHELRTPLNAIIGFSEILGAEIFGKLGDERQREYVKLIHESGAHLLQVVNDILDMSKIESGNFDIVAEPFDIAQLIESTRQMMAHQAEAKGLKLAASIGMGLPELAADRRACKQILINLLSNAIKFTDRGGQVTIGARREGESVAFYVRDNGIGIGEKDLLRVGTPFVQADSGYDRRHEGTGLGLSVVKGLAALHGGAMQIESRLGEGTCVTVRVPVNAEAVVAQRKLPAPPTVVALQPGEAETKARLKRA